MKSYHGDLLKMNPTMPFLHSYTVIVPLEKCKACLNNNSSEYARIACILMGTILNILASIIVF